MKKKLLIALALTALTASSAFGAINNPRDGVLGSVHDMNVLGGLGIAKDEQGRVCAFCHTPHHAIVDNTIGNTNYLPLWSHDLTSGITYKQYDSGTFDAKQIGTIDPLYGPSRLCMSCHDGAIAPDQHYGADSSTHKLFPKNDFIGTVADPSIGIGAGGALNRTHPIGFDLAAAVLKDQGATGSNAGGTGFVANLDTSATYGRTGTKKISSQLYNGYMTCATCHDVHNKDNVVNNSYDSDHPDIKGKNYLVFAKQAGSQLCLSCHDK